MEKKLVDELKSVVGSEGASTEPETLALYCYDAAAETKWPEIVLWPRKEEEVSAVLRVADREEVPVYVRGAATGRAGGSVPDRGGIVISFEKMDRVLEVDGANRQVVVEPGVRTGDLKREVAKHGLFYPPDPASSEYSTIGGNIATCAGGLACLKYGTTRDYVQQLRVVLAGGDIITVGSKAQKSVTGYDFVRLLVGSEGTLGVIVRARLRLLPLPRNRATLLAEFPSVNSALEAVAKITAHPSPPFGLEFADRRTIECARKYAGADVSEDCEALLLAQTDSEEAERDIGVFAGICRKEGATRVESSSDPDEQDALWAVRRSFSGATFKAAKKKVAEDIGVPVGSLREALPKIYAVGERHDRRILCFGHAGDGNIHVNILTDDPDDPEIEAVVEDVFRAVLELGGTLTGEHGVGTLKAPYIGLEIGPRELELMKQVKGVFDPKGILNPGKIFGAEKGGNSSLPGGP
jgi:glycolate oxidase